MPAIDGLEYPETLYALRARDLRDFLSGPQGWQRRAAGLRGSRAGDWTRLEDRMGYIVKLFRCFHLDRSVMAAPYEETQITAVAAGTVPSGRL